VISIYHSKLYAWEINSFFGAAGIWVGQEEDVLEKL